MGDNGKPGLLDLEKELSCSICTEILYQPLTVLECLHTFCGSCLKEWFSWQATQASPTKTSPFTCPSCRASVVKARPNANVTTLLELYLQANPGKARSAEEKEGIKQRYTPGENIMPKISRKKENSEEAEDRRMVEEVRDLSLREVGIRGGGYERGVRHRARNATQNDQAAEEITNGSSSYDASRARQVNHQSSLRSILSNSDLGDSTEMEEEILRQITDEGILEGIDLNNMTASQEEELTEKIAEAYRRRHRHRQRQRSRSRGNHAPARRRSQSQESDPATENWRQRRPVITPSPHSNSPNLSRSAVPRPQRLAPQVPAQSGRRRNSSENRRQTSPASTARSRTSSSIQREAARSETDLSNPTSSSGTSHPRSRDVASSHRRTTDPDLLHPTAQTRDRSSDTQDSRASQRRARIPVSSSTVHPSSTVAIHSSDIEPGKREQDDRSAIQGAAQTARSPPTSPHTPPTQTITSSEVHQFQEPLISCKRCGKAGLEYDLHWNCDICDGGAYSICQRCYREGKGCLHWYGFGYAAAQRYERQGPPPSRNEPPHRLTGHRYLQPSPESIPNGSTPRRTTSDPATRLQSGPFCSTCSAHAPSCFWQCSTCNEGEWGFCNPCVNRGRCCTHALLPVTLTTHLSVHKSPPTSPNNPKFTSFAPATASPTSRSSENGIYAPLTISTHCDNCTYPIPPSTTRFHCPQCNDGDYDLCTSCFLKLVKRGTITPENGPKGWRRCPSGHRIIVIGFEDSGFGQRRIVVEDLVGGHALKEDGGSKTTGRSDGVTSSTPEGATTAQSLLLQQYPPSGGLGMHVLALWSWWPQEGVKDELGFPKGAEVREVEDLNQDWYWGVYCGMKGVFPGAYVRMIGTGS